MSTILPRSVRLFHITEALKAVSKTTHLRKKLDNWSTQSSHKCNLLQEAHCKQEAMRNTRPHHE
jgi:hypothetical protein